MLYIPQSPLFQAKAIQEGGLGVFHLHVSQEPEIIYIGEAFANQSNYMNGVQEGERLK